MAENTSRGGAKRTPARTPAPEPVTEPEVVESELPPTEVPEGSVAYRVSVKLDGSDDPGSLRVFVPKEEQDVDAYIELELGEKGIDKDRILGFEVGPEGDATDEPTDPPADPEPTEEERLAALANLANPSDDEDTAVTEPEVVEIQPNGNVIDLSGGKKGDEYVVLKSLFTIVVDRNYRVARKGDTVLLTKDQAKRGVEKDALRKV